MKRWFNNLKIARKLTTGFLLVVILLIAVGGVGTLSILRINANDTKLYQEDTLGLRYAADASKGILSIHANSLQRHTLTTQEEITPQANLILSNLTVVDTAMDNFEASVTSQQLLSYIGDLRKNWALYKEGVRLENEAALRGEPTQANPEMAALAEKMQVGFTELFEMVSQEAKEVADKNTADARITIASMVVVVLVSAGASLVIARLISNGISRPIQVFEKFATMVAVGDLNVDQVAGEKERAWAQRKDEIGGLARAFDEMIASTTEQAHKTRAIADGDLTTQITVRSEQDEMGHALTELVDKFHVLTSSIVNIAQQVNAGAGQVSNGAQALSTGTTQQAATVEELASSITNVSERAVQNSINVEKAAEYMTQAGKGVEDGTAQMQRLNASIREIAESSQQISKITKLVDDIAFQTNILALNAAVEAARAGNAGKGFAVVADEVRNLAAKSAQAAKQTADLIQKSVAAVSEGESLAGETLTLLMMVSEKTQMIEKTIGEIEQASQEQASSIEQINQGLMQVSAVVQTNAATAEQSSAASQELAAQAQVLQQEVGTFTLRKDAGAVMPALGSAASLASAKQAPAALAAAEGYGKY